MTSLVKDVKGKASAQIFEHDESEQHDVNRLCSRRFGLYSFAFTSFVVRHPLRFAA